MKKNNFSVLKLLIFLMLFLVILTLFLLFYIIPVLKKYKTNEVVLKKYEVVYKKEKKELNFLKKKKKLLKQKYKKSLTKYEQKFDKNDFINYINLSFKNFKIEQTNKKNSNKYKIFGELTSINEIILLIDKINIYKNIIKITFPITIEKKDKLYKVSLYVTVINKKLKNDL